MSPDPAEGVIDISVGVHPRMLTWPSDPDVRVDPASRISQGKAANVSLLHLGSHTGTHVDPPLHFIEGAAPVDQLPLDALIGTALVADLRHVQHTIGVDELQSLGLPEGLERILFKTSNSDIWREASPVFPESYVALAPEGAEWLVARGIRLVGTDFLSIEKRGSAGHPTHLTLLRAGVVIVEGLNLGEVTAGSYELICLPLKLIDGDGAPARAVLSPTR